MLCWDKAEEHLGRGHNPFWVLGVKSHLRSKLQFVFMMSREALKKILLCTENYPLSLTSAAAGEDRARR